MTRTTDFKSVPITSESQTRRPRFSGLSQSAAVLFRLGTSRARLAAALLVVAGGLPYHTEAQALEQASRKVLYLDAPSVSVPRAERATQREAMPVPTPTYPATCSRGST